MQSIGRTVGVLRAGAHVLRRGAQQVPVRKMADDLHQKALYRHPPPVTRFQRVWGELLSSSMWFWILWNFWHTPDAVLGHFPWPDIEAWTDEELGVPPDDEE
ncbi:NADH dehydrogenase [ubiquinone] 1 beta subcomplex subunit 2, mitochondrial [Salminus brasiliensis]|uniref:NADH dehydrogenase [ubiquinone] 1 beta subcomplex subunit 2, mitochondrial n=1 Tax=Salminus brasiliensis TaxID=930266 RepID=UPI003B830E25